MGRRCPRENAEKAKQDKNKVFAFQWKTETVYLPNIVIAQEERTLADERLVSKSNLPLVEVGKAVQALAQDQWDPGWEEEEEAENDNEEDDDEDDDDLFEKVVIKKGSKHDGGKSETGSRVSSHTSPRKREPTPLPVPPASPSSKSRSSRTKSTAAEIPVSTENEEERKESASSELLKQRINNRKALFKNLFHHQPTKKCDKCNESYEDDEDSHQKVCSSQQGRKLSLGGGGPRPQTTFRTFDLPSKPTELKCSDCGKTFQKRIHLTLHQKIHASMDKPVVTRTANKTFPCRFCDRKFERNDDLLNHFQKEHKISNNVHVHQLNTENRGPAPRREEEKKNIKFVGDEFECEKCGRMFTTWNQVNIHIRFCRAKVRLQQDDEEEDPEPPMPEPASPPSSTFQLEPEGWGNLWGSVKTPPPSQISTNSQVKSQQILEEDETSQDAQAPPSTTQSSTSTSSRHVEDAHQLIMPMPCKCSHCERTFQFQHRLDFHEKGHYQSCTSCKDQILSSDFPQHSAICTSTTTSENVPDEELEQASCEICGATFDNSFLLSQHSLVHTFSSETYLDTEESPDFQCNLPFGCLISNCAARFSHRSDRELHLEQKHSSENNNLGRCEECGRSFSSLFNLRRHRSAIHHKTPSSVPEGPTYFYIQKGWTHERAPNPHVLIKDAIKLAADEALERMLTSRTSTVPVSSSSSVVMEVKPEALKSKLSFPTCIPRMRGQRKLRREDIPIQSIYTCETCSKTFTQSQRRLYIIHLAEHKYPCQMCHLSFRTESLLQQHTQRHDDPSYSPTKRKRGEPFRIPHQSSYTCRKCGKSYGQSARTAFLMHLSLHRQLEVFKCQLCDRRCPSEKLLQQHYSRHEDPNYVPGQRGRPSHYSHIPVQSQYTCQTCARTFSESERPLYIQHLREHKFTCTICDRKFSSENILKQHVARHNDPGYVPGRKGRIRSDIPFQSRYNCTACDRSFPQSQRQRFLIHLSNHKREKMFKCHLCNKGLLSEKMLQQHLKRHEDPNYVPGIHGKFRSDVPIQKEYSCETCGKTFPGSERTPYLLHIDEHKHPCQLCDRSYRSETLLQQHVIRHQDPNYIPGKKGIGRLRTDIPVQASYSCESCAKIFKGSERTAYIQHLREHKYTCHLCDRMFLSDAMLKQHLKRHEDPNYVPGKMGRFRSDVPIQEEYTCETCGKTFPGSERTPYLLHIDEHKFPCQLCDRSFRSEALLQQHVIRHEDPNYVPGKRGIGRMRTDIPVQDSYSCETCAKIFKASERNAYIQHLREHKYTCRLCDRMFQSDNLLKQHLKRHEDPSFVPGRAGRFRNDIPIQEEYTCEICNRKFEGSERTPYLLHIAEHKYPCHLCDRSYRAENLLQQHLKRHEDPNYVPGQRGNFRSDVPIQDEYSCEVCNRKFDGSERTPYLLHIDEHKFPCQLCDRSFRSEALLQLHVIRHEDPNYVPGRRGLWRIRTDIPIQDSYTCGTCDKTFTKSQRRLYLIHLSQHRREEMYKCGLCGRKHLSEKLLQQHMKRHDDPRYEPGRRGGRRNISEMGNGSSKERLSCPLCDLQFRFNSALETHKKRHEDPSYTPRKRLERIPIQDVYTCEICQKQYSKRGTFQVHMYQHRARQKYGCHHCERKFSSNALLQQHLRKHLDPAFRATTSRLKWRVGAGGRGRKRADVPYQDVYHCEHCGDKNKSFTNRIKYLLHLRNHTLEENFGCSQCPRRFKTKQALASHVETHNSVKAYECEDCLKKFRTYNCLRIHKMKFCKKIPCQFQCQLCEDRFQTEGQLQKHFSRWHTDNRMSTCSSSNDGGGGGGGTDSVSEVEHPCPYCRQTFNTKFGLTRHICIYHPTSQAGMETKTHLLSLLSKLKNKEAGHEVFLTKVDAGGSVGEGDVQQPTGSPAEDEQETPPADDDMDSDDYGLDLSDMLATDFCETEMTEAPPSPQLPTPPKKTRELPAKRTYSSSSKNVCYCGNHPKNKKFKSPKLCHNRQCPCVKLNKRCGSKCQCVQGCLNSDDKEQEQQQIFREQRESMIIEEEAQQRDSPESNGNGGVACFNEDEMEEEELPVPVEDIRPSTSKGYSNIGMSSEFISLDDSQDGGGGNDFIDEADDVDPLGDCDPLQASSSETNDKEPEPEITLTSLLRSSSSSSTNAAAASSSVDGSISISNVVSVSSTSIPPPDSMESFSQSASLRCQFCKKNFKTMPTFVSHFLVHGAEFRTLTCPICTKDFKLLSDFIHHLDLHNRGVFQSCSKCSSKFKTKQDLERHLQVHHFKPMECGLCSEKFPTSQLMMLHWSKLHPTCQCGLCNVKFFSYDDLTFHMKSLHSPYDCVHCGARFEKIDPLLDHFLAKHYITLCSKNARTLAPEPAPAPPLLPTSSKTGAYNKKCDYCGLFFVSLEELNEHLVGHLTQGNKAVPPAPPGQVTPQITSTYSTSSSNPSSMVYMQYPSEAEERLNDNQNAVEVFTCPKCYRSYNIKNSWMTHLRSYNLPLCSACGSLFEDREELLRHLENKDGSNRPICVVFECRYCLQNFVHSKYLSTHMKKHERQRNAAAEATTNTAASSSTDSVPIIVASTSLAAAHQHQQEDSVPIPVGGSDYQAYQYVVVQREAPPHQQAGDIEEITLD